jgi:hypothetical protein
VAGELLDVIREAVTPDDLDRRHDVSVEALPPLVQKSLVGDPQFNQSIGASARILVKNSRIAGQAKYLRVPHVSRLLNYRLVNSPRVLISHRICKGLHREGREGFNKHLYAHDVNGMWDVGIVHESLPQPERGYRVVQHSGATHP